MKNNFKLGYKHRIGLLLLTLIAVLLLNSASVSRDFNDVQLSVTSIYKDRLLASTYIFDITDQLYQKRMLLEHAGMSEDVQKIDASIAKLIAKYETTYLTREERLYWTDFKQELSSYNAHSGLGQPRITGFTQIISSLKKLSDLQAGEGNSLLKNTSRIVNASSLHTYLETCIALLIGALTLSIIGSSKMRFGQPQPNPSLN